jgi:hypothetical protein
MKDSRRAHLGAPPCEIPHHTLWLVCRRSVLSAAVFAILFSLVSTARARSDQTNFFPVLVCKNRSYTNATIENFTAATVTIFWDGGGERIPMTNLPPELLTRYHYDPQAAEDYLKQQAAKKAAAQERAKQEAAALARALEDLGPAQRIRIVKIYSRMHFQIEAGGKVSHAYIHNLPRDFVASLDELNQDKMDAATLEAQLAQDKGATNKAASYAARTRAQKAAQKARQSSASSARAAVTEDTAALTKLKARVKELESHTELSASPTDYISSAGIRQWEYKAPETAEANPK